MTRNTALKSNVKKKVQSKSSWFNQQDFVTKLDKKQIVSGRPLNVPLIVFNVKRR